MTEPRLYLAAAPKEPAQIPTLTRPYGVRDLLENPPISRHAGFNLLTLDRARLIQGTRLRVSNGTRKHIDLLGDGTLLAAATFNDFLGWGRRDFFADPKANSIAVIEFTYDFVFLYEHLLAYVRPRPAEVRFDIRLDGAIFYDEDGNERKMYLVRGPITDFTPFAEYGTEEAASAGFSESVDAVASDAEPHIEVAEVAFELVSRFYNWFGHTDDAIPYTNEEATAIDIAQITSVR